MTTKPSATRHRKLDTREIKTILVPTDFSAAANNAFAYAANLAWSLQARLVAMNVYYTAPVAEQFAPPNFIDTLNAEKIKAAEGHFAEYERDLARMLGSDIEFETSIVSGYAPDRILEISRNHEVDLIVMGTLGQESMAEKILGSVTARVIERAGCPVLAVPKGVQYQPIRHILYAANLDATDDSVVIDQLLSYGDLFGANVSCVHVHTPDEDISNVDLEAFEDLYRAEIQSGKLSIQIVNNVDIVRGLHRYVITHQVDMVTLLTHRRHLEPNAWEKGLTRTFSLETDVPLLAFHEDI